MIFKFIGSIILFLGLLQFVFGVNVGEFDAAKRHLILVLAGTILIIFGILWKKKKQS
ncbi:MAG: hypothetical protein V3S49_05400 [Thermodesulfobacteriota bacterium]